MICPFDLSASFGTDTDADVSNCDELIAVGVITNPPILADTNLAKPSDVIDDDALLIVDGEPLIVAGVNN